MTIVETVVAVAIFSILATVAYEIYIGVDNLVRRADQKSTALWLAEEGIEATRSIREEEFSNLIDGDFGLAISSDKWNFSGTEDMTNGYLRSITLRSLDADSIFASSTVSWNYLNATNTVSLSTVFTNWRKIVVPVGNWGNATSTIFNLANNDDALKVQISGDYAFFVRGSGSQKLSVVDISDPYNLSTSYYNPDGNPRNIFVNGDYAYITNTHNAQELQIVDISDWMNPVSAGNYNAPGNANGLGIYVVGTRAYLTRVSSGDKEFVILDVSDPTFVTVVGTLDLTGSPNEVVVSGNYAYLASTNDNQELQIINISNPASPSLVGSLDIPSSTADAVTIAKTGNYVLLGYETTMGIVDVSAPASPVLMGVIDLLGTVNDISLNLANDNSYVFVATDYTSGEFQIVDISDKNNPVLLSGGLIDLTPKNVLNGIAYDQILDLAVGAGTENSGEVIIFIPQ